MLSNKTSVTIMTPIGSNLSYYNKYMDHYWSSLYKAVVESTEECDITICLRIFGEGDLNISKVMDDASSTNIYEFAKLDIKLLEGKGPARGTLLKEAVKLDTDYYVYLDFDDSIGRYYFQDFANKSHEGFEQIIPVPVREYDKLILPKSYLDWRPLPKDTFDTFFTSERYGHMIWGRFYSRSLIKRVIDQIDETYDRLGWGEEYKLLNLLYFNTQDLSKIGYCNSLYKWNYGDGTSLSKNIELNDALENIRESITVIPDALKYCVQEMYEVLLFRCFKNPSDLTKYQIPKQLELDFGA